MRKMIDRLKQPTPRFFKRLRNVGLGFAAVGAAVAGAPVVLPAMVAKLAGYLVLAGGVIVAVSQTAVKHDNE